MADSKITALASISTSTDPAVDPLVIVDVSDTSMAASGTSKKVTLNNLLSSSPTASGAFSVTGLVTAGSATITGALTTQSTPVKLASQGSDDCTVFIGPDVPAATHSGRIGFLTTNTYKNWNVLNSWNTVGAFEIAQNTTVGGSVLSSNPTFRINSDNSFNFLDGAGGTRMTLDSTGLGIGASPAAKLYVYAANVSGIGQFRIDCPAAGVAQQTFAINGVAQGQVYADGAQFVIGSTTSTPLVFRTGSTVQATIDTSGNLLVGQTTVAGANIDSFVYNKSGSYVSVSHVNGTSSGTAYLQFLYNNTSVGTITQNGTTGVLYNITSDYRLKESVKPILGGLARVNALKPSIYNWKSDGSTGEGFLAHELAEVVPFAVSGEKDAMNADGTIKSQGIDMSRIVPILVSAIQELTARVQTLEAR